VSTSYIVKTGYQGMKKTSFLELPVTIVVLLSVAIFTSSYSMQQSANAILTRNGGEVVSSDFVKAPIATSGDNVYTAWPNNDTGHWGVFFAKSIDGGKTLGKTVMLSAPNKGNVVDLNVDIAASGNNVLVTWWTNKTGILMPVFKASNDNGNTFGKTMILNSTSPAP
jgi:hypothetical protein